MQSHEKERLFRILAWGATILLAVIIAMLTLTPSVTMAVPSNDKLNHFLAFASLSLPLTAAYPRRILPIILVTAAYGLAIEIIQPHFGRSAEAADLLADLLGAVVGAFLGRWLGRWLRRSPTAA